MGDYRTASAQDTQTQAAIAGALLAYRTGPDQDVFTTNQITSALVAYRSAADQDTATASSIAAALLSYYTIAQVDGLLAGKLGVTEAASALQIAVRFPDDGGADEVVAAIGEQILGPTDVSLSNWTVRPSSGCSVVLATHTAGVSVDGYTLTLAANPWNIVRTYNLTPGRELLFACRYRLGTASNFVVYMSEADNVYDPLYGSFVGDEGASSTATVPPDGVAKLHFGAHFQAPGLPNQTAGTVDVYGLQILDATLEAGNTAEEDTAASALLLKHEFLDGGADDVTLATLGEVLLEPTLTTLGNFLVRSNSQSSVASASFAVGGFQLEGYGQRRELHHGGRRVHGHADGLGRSNRGKLRSHGALTGVTLTITGAASTGPLDCESLDCTFTATSGGVSTGSVVCGDVTSSGTVSAPQLFASNTLAVTNTSDFSDDLFLTKNWAGWSKLQVSNNSAAPDSGPELRLLGNQSTRVFLERDGGAHQCELIMINDEALVQTKSLSTQLSLTTNQRNPGCLVIAGNTGNVVCNTSFTTAG